MTKFYAKLVTYDAGYSSDQQKVKDNLTLNEYYEITSITIHSWMTDIKLLNLEGTYNSVFFKFYNEDKILLKDDVFDKEIQDLVERTGLRYD